MQSPSDASLLKCMETDCKELNLKAQFLHHLPDISLLTKRLTILNLSFNMLKVPVCISGLKITVTIYYNLYDLLECVLCLIIPSPSHKLCDGSVFIFPILNYIVLIVICLCGASCISSQLCIYTRTHTYSI